MADEKKVLDLSEAPETPKEFSASEGIYRSNGEIVHQDEALHNITAGKWKFSPDRDVDLIDPDGKVVPVKGAQVQQLYGQGYRLPTVAQIRAQTEKTPENTVRSRSGKQIFAREAEAQIISGRAKFGGADKPLWLVDKETGEATEYDAEVVPELLRSGKHRLRTIAEEGATTTRREQVTDDIQNVRKIGAAADAIVTFTRKASFGAIDIGMGLAMDPDDSARLQGLYDKVASEYKVSHGVAAVAGTVLPALAGGGVLGAAGRTAASASPLGALSRGAAALESVALKGGGGALKTAAVRGLGAGVETGIQAGGEAAGDLFLSGKPIDGQSLLAHVGPDALWGGLLGAVLGGGIGALEGRLAGKAQKAIAADEALGPEGSSLRKLRSGEVDLADLKETIAANVKIVKKEGEAAEASTREADEFVRQEAKKLEQASREHDLLSKKVGKQNERLTKDAAKANAQAVKDAEEASIRQIQKAEKDGSYQEVADHFSRADTMASKIASQAKITDDAIGDGAGALSKRAKKLVALQDDLRRIIDPAGNVQRTGFAATKGEFGPSGIRVGLAKNEDDAFDIYRQIERETLELAEDIRKIDPQFPGAAGASNLDEFSQNLTKFEARFARPEHLPRGRERVGVDDVRVEPTELAQGLPKKVQPDLVEPKLIETPEFTPPTPGAAPAARVAFEGKSAELMAAVKESQKEIDTIVEAAREAGYVPSKKALGVAALKLNLAQRVGEPAVDRLVEGYAVFRRIVKDNSILQAAEEAAKEKGFKHFVKNFLVMAGSFAARRAVGSAVGGTNILFAPLTTAAHITARKILGGGKNGAAKAVQLTQKQMAAKLLRKTGKYKAARRVVPAVGNSRETPAPIKSYLQRLILPEARGESDFQKAQDSISRMTTNKAATEKIVRENLMALGQVAPVLADQAAVGAVAALDYLKKMMPASDLGPLGDVREPAPSEQRKWERIASVVLDPVASLDRLMDGVMSMPEIEALRETSPDIYAAAGQILFARALEEKDMPNRQKVQLSLFFGVPFTRSMEPVRLLNFQENFETAVAEDQARKEQLRVVPGQEPTPAQRLVGGTVGV